MKVKKLLRVKMHMINIVLKRKIIVSLRILCQKIEEYFSKYAVHFQKKSFSQQDEEEH